VPRCIQKKSHFPLSKIAFALLYRLEEYRAKSLFSFLNKKNSNLTRSGGSGVLTLAKDSRNDGNKSDKCDFEDLHLRLSYQFPSSRGQNYGEASLFSHAGVVGRAVFGFSPLLIGSDGHLQSIQAFHHLSFDGA